MKNENGQASGLAKTIGNTDTGHYYWIGHCSNGVHYFAGQTFKVTEHASLKHISIFPEMIVGETDVLLSVFEFDAIHHTWKDKKAEHHVMLDHRNAQQWVSFPLQVPLDAHKHYAFKLSCNHGGMMAVAESSWNLNDPYPDGEQWVGSSEEPAGRFHRNFDLSFKAEFIPS